MAGYFKKVKTPWTSQPQSPVRVKFDHPFAKDLISFQYSKFAQNRSGFLPISGVFGYGVGPTGAGLKFTGTVGEYAKIDTGQTLTDTEPCSIEIIYTAPTQPNLSAPITFSSYDTTDGIPYVTSPNPDGKLRGMMAYQGSTPPNIDAWGASKDFNSGVAHLTTRQHIIITKAAGTGATLCNIYRNGVLIASGNVTNATAWLASGPYLYLGARHGAATANMTGVIEASSVCRRVIDAEEARQRYNNIYSILEPQERKVFVSVATSGVTGTLTSTLDSFTSNLLGTTTIVGSINNTFSSFTSSITGSSTIVGQIAYTNQDVTSNITGTTAVVGQIAVTNQNNTSNITGNVGSGVTGIIDSALQNSTSSIQGTTQITGTMSVIMESFTSVIQGTTTILGTISKTMDDFISSISGFIGEAKARLLSLLGVGS